MRLLVVILLFLILVPNAVGQSSPKFNYLREDEIEVTVNDIGQDQYSRSFSLLVDNTIIPEESDEVLIQLNISNFNVPTGLELTLINEQFNTNSSHPIQSLRKVHTIEINPLKDDYNLTVLVHWYSLLPSSSCQSCDFKSTSNIELRFFTDQQEWDNSGEANSRIGHRERLVTLYDYERLVLETPGVDIGRVDLDPTTTYEENSDASYESESTSLSDNHTSENSEDGNVISSIRDLPYYTGILSLLVIATIRYRDKKKRDC